MSDEWVVAMPKLGETVTEGEITSWFKAAGDVVAFDDPLFEVSTDKVDSEIPSPYDGVLLEILVSSGETVPVGTPLVRIGPPGSTPGAQAPHAGVDVPAAATRSTAAAGGPSLGDPAAPQVGGSEGPVADASGAVIGTVHDITMPKLGETVTEGTIGNWLKQAGDTVAFDDPLFEVSTDKVDSEIPSPYDGVLLEILVAPGETVPVGTPLARIGEPGAVSAATPAAAPVPAAAPAVAVPPATNGSAPGAREGRLLSPLVRRLVEEAGLDVALIAGTGAGGRIRREDVERAVASGAAVAAAPAPAPAPV
ncbi:biotin/lipoyl-containing protein, partial [Pseudonocardia sp.]|uniref:biotin/lipoyl-containing protein n=1 Tax=Pseudonocardia sp. TaxID=60912 RepID=UPI0026370EEA